MSPERVEDSSAAGRLAAVEAAARGTAERRGQPPVERWNPPLSGRMDLVIRRDGTWIHEGRPILREALVRLFATILRRDPDGFVLVTPVEKWAITVEDAPFVAIDFEVAGDAEGQVLTFVTNVGDRVTAGGENTLRMGPDAGGAGAIPYLHVRRGLEAVLTRAAWYRLADIAVEGPDGGLGVWSSGVFLPLEESR